MMHNVTLTKNSQKENKIGQLFGSWQTPPMEGGVRTTLKEAVTWIQFVISISSYVKLVDRVCKTAEKNHSSEITGNHFFAKTCQKVMATIMAATSLALSYKM
jgi:hypothetical protein